MAIVPTISDTRYAWSPPDTPEVRPLPEFTELSWLARAELAGIDDLNRLTLEATCEVLPLCRDRNVTLLVRLASEAMRVRVDSRLLERTVFDMLEAASGFAQLDQGFGRLDVSTRRRDDWGEFCVSVRGAHAGRTGHLSELLPGLREVMESFGGSLSLSLTKDQVTLTAALPLDQPGTGQPEKRWGFPPRATRAEAPLGVNDVWSRSADGDAARAAPRPSAPGAF